jgi:hypothetical protein
MSNEEVRLLVFSKTGGFRHDSIPAALEAMETLADEHVHEGRHAVVGAARTCG